MKLNTPFPLQIEYLQSGSLQTGQDWHRDPETAGSRAMQFSKLYWVKEGSGELWIDDRKLILEPGHIYLVPEGVDFGYQGGKLIHLFWLHFTLYQGLGLNFFNLCKYRSCIHERDHPCLKTCINHLSSIPGTWERSLMQASLILLIEPFVLSFDIKHSEQTFAKVIHDYLHHLQADQACRLTVGEMAGELNISSAHLNRLFRQQYGVSPKQYLMNTRLNYCRELLATTDVTLETIAGQSGFHDAFHLSKAFKNKFGLSPKDYRVRRRTHK